MNNFPMVSILMNCYNGDKYLKEAIESILSQTYQNWELIFWDNQSSDKSAEIFLSYKDSRLNYYFSSNHTTLGKARIMASKKIKGDWIGIIDTDDLWEPTKLAKQIFAINNSKYPIETIGLVYCRTMGIDSYGRNINKINHSDFEDRPMPEGKILCDLLLKGNFIASPSILIRKNFFQNIGGFPDKYSHASDYYISCAISNYSNVIYVNEFLAKYRVHDNNNSFKEKVLSFEEQLSIFDCWSGYINVSLIKKIKKTKELHTMAGLMEIKHDKKILKGIFRIIIKGNLIFAIKSIFFELRKLFE